MSEDSTAAKTKTQEDIDHLMHQWVDDPCWEIEDTEGFEEFYDELLQYRLIMEEKWQEEAKEKLLQSPEHAIWQGHEMMRWHIDHMRNGEEISEEMLRISALGAIAKHLEAIAVLKSHEVRGGSQYMDKVREQYG